MPFENRCGCYCWAFWCGLTCGVLLCSLVVSIGLWHVFPEFGPIFNFLSEVQAKFGILQVSQWGAAGEAS